MYRCCRVVVEGAIGCSQSAAQHTFQGAKVVRAKINAKCEKDIDKNVRNLRTNFLLLGKGVKCGEGIKIRKKYFRSKMCLKN